MSAAKAYKLFRRAKGGGLRPLYVLSSEEIPLGVWLPAKRGPLSGDGAHVASRLGPLAFRPGWHLCELPLADHIGRRAPDGSGRLLQAPDTVWAEVEYGTDADYGPEAGPRGLPKVPEGGFYRFRTNPKAKVGWIIAGEIRVLRALSAEEVADACRAAGLEPQPVWPGEPVDPDPGKGYNKGEEGRSAEKEEKHAL